MILTGFTDEVSSDLNVQIQVTKELGWQYLSARTVGEKNIHEISVKQFEEVCDKLDEAEIKVAEFGTLIGNWGKSIMSDWEITKAEVFRCIARMQRLGVKFARIMSFAQEPWGEEQYEKERFARLRWITATFADAGLQALHENCMNWGGFSPDHTLRLLDEVPGLQLVFDTGNPVFQRDRSKSPPYPWQNAWEFYQKVKHAIAHIHIKDAKIPPGETEPLYTFPGEGNACVREIIQDLKDKNYQGFIAIEPHMGKVFHEDDQDNDMDYQYQVYLEYGRRMEQLL